MAVYKRAMVLVIEASIGSKISHFNINRKQDSRDEGDRHPHRYRAVTEIKSVGGYFEKKRGNVIISPTLTQLRFIAFAALEHSA